MTTGEKASPDPAPLGPAEAGPGPVSDRRNPAASGGADLTAPASRRSRISGAGSTAARLLSQNGLLFVLLAWVIFLFSTTDTFFTGSNILLVLRQSSTIGIVAIGATGVILLGEIDLSLGAIVSVTGVIAAKLMISAGWGAFAGAVAAVVVGLVAGLVNGLLVTALRINSFMATLGMMSVLGGLAFLLTGGHTLFGDQLDSIAFLANGYLLGIPFPVILLFLFYVVALIVLTRTGYGARVYAVGNNLRASFLAGIRVNAVKVSTFGLAGLLAGFGGFMQLSRLNAASGDLGADLLFPVITAVVLGGVSLTGGRGRIQDVFIASVFLATIANGLILLGVDAYTQQVVSGAILIAALGLDRWRRV